ncbi:glycosyltransferase [Microbacterium sp. B2969]|uniref:Glycosyltransferase n=1 Tax=Microbacterium alkaliflavum TaxID=3248839 RepID=A0ABW7Q7E1_9MICO
MKTDTEPRRATTTGWIALAAYKPDPALFERQLRSIQSQTVQDFRVVICADGGQGEVRALVARLTDGDQRFSVVGADDRLGFYRNFERALRAVPPEAAWVALSDQDDFWHADKLERMLPHLEAASMVAGQARVVRYPDETVLNPNTDRRNVAPDDLPAFNQFTGGMSVLRRDLLDLALPFPHSDSPAQVHDHWLALCAAVAGGAIVIPDIVQDYVQHGGNVLGESEDDRLRPAASWRRISDRARSSYGSASVGALAAVAFDASAGWAATMTDTLAERLPDDPAARRLASLYGRRSSWWRMARHLGGSALSRRVPARNAVVQLVGSSLRPIARRRGRR